MVVVSLHIHVMNDMFIASLKLYGYCMCMLYVDDVCCVIRACCPYAIQDVGISSCYIRDSASLQYTISAWFQTSCLDRVVSDNNNTLTTLPTSTTPATSLPGYRASADPALTRILRGSGPYPMVLMPTAGGYWIDGDVKSDNLPPLEPSATAAQCSHAAAGDADVTSASSRCRYQLEMDETSKCYRKHFLGRVSTFWDEKGKVYMANIIHDCSL